MRHGLWCSSASKVFSSNILNGNITAVYSQLIHYTSINGRPFLCCNISPFGWPVCQSVRGSKANQETSGANIVKVIGIWLVGDWHWGRHLPDDFYVWFLYMKWNCTGICVLLRTETCRCYDRFRFDRFSSWHDLKEVFAGPCILIKGIEFATHTICILLHDKCYLRHLQCCRNETFSVSPIIILAWMCRPCSLPELP